MKHEKEWYTCDRCGEEIQKLPSDSVWMKIKRKVTMTAEEYRMTTAESKGYITDIKYLAPDVLSAEILTYYETNNKSIHLCGKCRKAFERFMRNGNNG